MYRVTLLVSLILMPFVVFAAQGKGKSQSPDQARLSQAQALHGQGKVKESLALYKAILQDNPNKAERLAARKGLILAELETGELDQANQEFTTLLQDHKQDQGIGRAILEIGQLHQNRGRYDQARACYDRVIRDYASEPNAAMWAHQSYALMALSQDNIQQADQHMQSIRTQYLTDKDTPMALERLGKAYNKLGHNAQAKTLFQDSLNLAVQNKDFNMQAWNRKALALMQIRDGQYDQAQAQVDAVIRDCRGHKGWADALSALARESLEDGQTDQAITVCRKVLNPYSSDPNTARLWPDLARAHIVDGQDSQASEAVDQLIRKWPLDTHMPDYLFDIAHEWEKSDRHDLANGLFRRARRSFVGTDGYRTADGLDVLIAKSQAMAALTSNSNPQGAARSFIAVSRRNDMVNPKLLYETGNAYAKAGFKQASQDLLAEASTKLKADSTVEDKQYAAISRELLGQSEQANQLMEDVYQNAKHERKYGEAIYDFGLLYFNQTVGINPLSDPNTVKARGNQAHKWLSRYIETCAFNESWTPIARYKQAQISLRLKQYSRARTELESWLNAYQGHDLTPRISFQLTRCYRDMVFAGLITQEESQLLSNQWFERIVTDYPESQEAAIAKRYLGLDAEEAIQ